MKNLSIIIHLVILSIMPALVYGQCYSNLDSMLNKLSTSTRMISKNAIEKSNLLIKSTPADIILTGSTKLLLDSCYSNSSCPDSLIRNNKKIKSNTIIYFACKNFFYVSTYKIKKNNSDFIFPGFGDRVKYFLFQIVNDNTILKNRGTIIIE